MIFTAACTPSRLTDLAVPSEVASLPASPSSRDDSSVSETAEPPPCLQIIRIEVWKATRVLRAFCARGALVEMGVAVGRQAQGPKRSIGDSRTPEGQYRIAGEARRGRFHLFIPIDYPSRADAEWALADGRLSRAAYEEIMHAHDQALPPPHDTVLGGGIGFHGEGERWQGESRLIDWTYGCIAVTDSEIEFLAERLVPGVPVWIHP